MIDLLKELTLAEASCGGEGPVREILMRELKGHAHSVSTDPLGNLIAVKAGSSEHAPRVMITAHMDEIGARVASVQRNGLINFVKMGLIDDRVLPSRMVTIHTSSGKVDGVIGMPAPQTLTEAERREVLPAKKLAIDIGAAGREDVEGMGVQIGDMVCFKGQFFPLRNNRVLTKSLDNRAGVLVLAEVLRRLSEEPHHATLVAVGTVQEEVGARGAITAAAQILPDIAFPLDVIPQAAGDEIIQMGKGPVLRLFELGGHGHGVVVPQDLRDFILAVARKSGIPCQLALREGGRTEASEIHLIGKGIPSCAIEIPARYIHSASEIISMNDIHATIELVLTLIREIPSYLPGLTYGRTGR